MAFQVLLFVAAVFLQSANSADPDKPGVVLSGGKAIVIQNYHLLKSKSNIINMHEAYKMKEKYMRDCDALFKLGYTESGIYVIQPVDSPYLVVHCNMSYDCSGWTTFQRNTRNSEMTWTEAWTSFKYGFGNIEGDHYLGNHYMQLITRHKWYKMRVVLDKDDDQKYAEYSSMKLEAENYNLKLGAFKGGATDALSSSVNMVDNMGFSAKDMDNDNSRQNCADKYGGGFWFNTCDPAMPTVQLNQRGRIYWGDFCDDCRHVTMIVKPVDMYCRPEDWPMEE
uniref:Fibrinogen-like protein 1-like protein n=1 Tax=Callorhinchus milii TaxID=7868 RepID=K4G592_CALMI|nr:fibrinogen-like protein 1-like protein [Callorhinchus milii]